MAKQLEVVRYRDLVPVSNIPRFVPGLGYPTIEIIGDDFSSVERILVNEVNAPEFIILTKHKMYVQLPPAAYERITTIEVLSSKFTKNSEGSKVSYELGSKTRTVEGILKLVQLFMKWMLQSPGSDIFNLDRGGGLQDMAGRLISNRTMDTIVSAVSRAVTSTTSQIRTAQNNVRGLPASERLLSADLVDISVFDKQMQAQVKVKITSVAGADAVSSLEL
jgi:hypothetical protein